MKFTRFLLILFVLIVSTIQYGCVSSRTMYAVPKDVDVARVDSAIRSTFRSEEQIVVSILKEEVECGPLGFGNLAGQRILFITDQSRSFPDGQVLIEANKPLRLRFFLGGSGASGRPEMGGCEIFVDVTFEAGKNYTLFGGRLLPENQHSALRCMFGIKDQSIGAPVKVRQLFRESLCASKKIVQ